MRLSNFLKQLISAKELALKCGVDIGDIQVNLETINDNGEIYYEENFSVFVDGSGEIGLSANNK